MEKIQSVKRSKVALAKASTVVAAVALVVAAGVFIASVPALALTGFTANDVSVDTDDGELSELTIAPSGTVSWSGLDSEAEKLHIQINVHNDTTNVYAADQITAVNGTTNSVDFAFDEINLLDEADTKNATSANYLETDQFSAADGTSKETTLEVQVNVYILDSDSVIENITEWTSFVVTVTNNEGVLTASGTVNTGGSD